MSLQIRSEHRSEDITEEGKAGLRLDVKVLLRYIQYVMLSSITEAVDHLHGQGLNVSQEFYFRIGKTFSNTRVEADCLLQDSGLKKHLESVVQEDENAMRSAGVGWPVEKLDAQHQRLKRLSAQ